ncbi:nuclear transport factor 2 family protein [Nonomuraea longicatena]|uniref:SnoaL-like domain-containing protein n=1 Tax=Nonomuraea longicatena TaxID=83682 RepID=A0ABN1R954_9ACTN
MTSKTVEDLYAAFAAADPAALLATLHPDFVLDVSPGMPLGVGKRHHGRENALMECWAVIFGAYETAPVPDQYIWAAPDRCVVLGHYLGTARATGRPLDAVFAHDLTLKDGLITNFVQITDTARWHESLGAPPTAAAA